MARQDDWEFFTDAVMGGVSTGRLDRVIEEGRPVAVMTGQVSTANRGGFIQMRRRLSAVPDGAAGVRLVARGNGQRYFVHLRTVACRLPWQFHQADFTAPGTWTEVRLPFDTFRAAGGLAEGPPRPETLTSLAIAAYGRDHAAEVAVAEAGVF